MTAWFEGAVVWDRGQPPYPDALLDLRRPPPQLHAVGNASVLERQSIAIVGARQANPTSRAFARRLARALARAGACVVSGLAVGVDAAAHEGALDAEGGRTCAVLGGGMRHGVPAPNRALAGRIAERGLIMSEWPVSMPPDRWMYPQRNRIIAALSHATIIVQASSTSGSLHTAHAAIELERTLGVVPGPVDCEAHRGSNRLLDHPNARVILEPEDAVALLSPRIELTAPAPQFSDDEARVWDALANGPVDVDLLAIRASPTTARGLAAITTLEVAGAVECGMVGEVRRK